MFKKIILINSFLYSFLYAGMEDTINIKMKVWDMNNLTTKELRFERDNVIIKQWFMDKSADLALITGLKDRNAFRYMGLPYNSYYFKYDKGWGQLLRSDKLSTEIRFKKLTYPDTANNFKNKMSLYFINKDVVLVIVDFKENGFQKMKDLYNYVMPYFIKEYKIKRENFIIVGNIIVKDKKNYKKLKRYFKFFISEGNKIKKVSIKKYRLVGLKDVVTTIKSTRVKKAYVDYSLAASQKYGKKNINLYVKKISQEYPVNLFFYIKKNKK